MAVGDLLGDNDEYAAAQEEEDQPDEQIDLDVNETIDSNEGNQPRNAMLFVIPAQNDLFVAS